MSQLTERQQTYSRLSSALACLSNKQLEQMLVEGKVMHKGIGGASLQIEIGNTPVFVKKVPLTDLELQPENYMSTANIFNLPMCYQYGIGSSDEEQIALDKDATYWENNASINSRLKAIALATHHTYLFLEFIPNHLYGWLSKQLSTNESTAINAVIPKAF